MYGVHAYIDPDFNHPNVWIHMPQLGGFSSIAKNSIFRLCLSQNGLVGEDAPYGLFVVGPGHRSASFRTAPTYRRFRSLDWGGSTEHRSVIPFDGRSVST